MRETMRTSQHVGIAWVPDAISLCKAAMASHNRFRTPMAVRLLGRPDATPRRSISPTSASERTENAVASVVG
jgi:hypothetical protein